MGSGCSGLPREPAADDARFGCRRHCTSPARSSSSGELQPARRLVGDRTGSMPQQAETLRKMLLAVAADPRLVVARLAEQLVRLRHARELAERARRRLALETREILAPLANRLGVWNLKWELEDLAFRYLEPEEYQRIARALAERRVDREQLHRRGAARCSSASCAGRRVPRQVYGRPKHIYSIWRKMQRKHVGFERAVRRARGAHRGRDDRRLLRGARRGARPVALHAGRVRRLHRHAQGQRVPLDPHRGDRTGGQVARGPDPLARHARARRARRRRALALQGRRRARCAATSARSNGCAACSIPTQAADADGDPIERLKSELFADRIYAMTPKGEVVDLPRGATPLDFAYHVHTDLGHRCRGAKVNGRIVPLNQPLANGQVVEIITGKQRPRAATGSRPSRASWLSARSRAKVRAWFRAHR